MNHQQSEFDSLARSTAKVVTEATLTSALRVQLDLMGKTGEKLIEEHRMKCAETLLTAGITLIPCDNMPCELGKREFTTPPLRSLANSRPRCAGLGSMAVIGLFSSIGVHERPLVNSDHGEKRGFDGRLMVMIVAR